MARVYKTSCKGDGTFGAMQRKQNLKDLEELLATGEYYWFDKYIKGYALLRVLQNMPSPLYNEGVIQTKRRVGPTTLRIYLKELQAQGKCKPLTILI